MARILPLILLATLAVADDEVRPAVPLSITCPIGTEKLERVEDENTFHFCASKPVACPISDNVESLEVEESGKRRCRIANGPAYYINSDGSRLEMTYKNGLLEGISATFSPSGRKTLEETYRKGVKSGLRTVWDQQTQKKILEERYKNGTREGLSESWFENGSAKSAVIYHDGQRDGKYQEWYANGKRRRAIVYRRGIWNGLLSEFYANGERYREAHYKEGVLDGEYRTWFSSGKRQSERMYLKGKVNGMFKEWDANGTLISSSRYENGKLTRFYVRIPKPGSRELAGEGQALITPECNDVFNLAGLSKPQVAWEDGKPKCLGVDLDSNGYADYVFMPPAGITQSSVVLMRAGEMIQRAEIEDSGLLPYPISPTEGTFGEPVAFNEGLISRGAVTKVYLYDFDSQKFQTTILATE